MRGESDKINGMSLYIDRWIVDSTYINSRLDGWIDGDTDEWLGGRIC